MNPKLTDAVNALKETAQFVAQQRSDGNLLSDQHGWNNPAISALDLAQVPGLLAQRLEAIDTELTSEIEEFLATVPARMHSLRKKSVIVHMFNGNGPTAIPQYLGTFDIIERRLSPLFSWQEPDSQSLPPALLRRLSSLRRSLENAEASAGNVSEKVRTINSAHDAAHALPETLASLDHARRELEQIGRRCEEIYGNVDKTLTDSHGIKNLLDAELAMCQKHRKTISEMEKECSEVLGGFTAHGLAFSFEESAHRLRRTTLMWVTLLILALVTGGLVGAARFTALSNLLNISGNNATVQWPSVTVELILSVVSLAGPIWMAWLATKQVGQNFRLAEDYAFKAAVSKAYEGFRRQTANMNNQQFSEQLLASALSRFDEPPLRWVNQESHGSPWHEMIESEGFQKALKMVPELNYAFQNARRKAGRDGGLRAKEKQTEAEVITTPSKSVEG